MNIESARDRLEFLRAGDYLILWVPFMVDAFVFSSLAMKPKALLESEAFLEQVRRQGTDENIESASRWSTGDLIRGERGGQALIEEHLWRMVKTLFKLAKVDRTHHSREVWEDSRSIVRAEIIRYAPKYNPFIKDGSGHMPLGAYYHKFAAMSAFGKVKRVLGFGNLAEMPLDVPLGDGSLTLGDILADPSIHACQLREEYYVGGESLLCAIAQVLLTANDRLIFHSRLQKATYAEIAKLIGLTEARICQRSHALEAKVMARARTLLRERLHSANDQETKELCLGQLSAERCRALARPKLGLEKSYTWSPLETISDD